MYLLFIPIALLTFGLSLLIGHFLSEPAALTLKRLCGYRVGDPAPAPLPIDGRIAEVDELRCAINALFDTIRELEANLALKEDRQMQFVSDVAHELRTPLTAIRGNAEMLLDPDLPPDMRKKFTDIIMEESSRLTALVNDLLTLQRMESAAVPFELERVDLGQITREVVDSLAPVLRERQANCSVSGEAPDVLGNKDRLKQVVFNLVDNASRFIEPGGHIWVELAGLRGSSILTVKDDGCGFGDVDPALLFDRFYRVDPSRTRSGVHGDEAAVGGRHNSGGTGLGLAIVKSVVEAHDGNVGAYNRVEGGACFIVAIPSIA